MSEETAVSRAATVARFIGHRGWINVDEGWLDRHGELVVQRVRRVDATISYRVRGLDNCEFTGDIAAIFAFIEEYEDSKSTHTYHAPFAVETPATSAENRCPGVTHDALSGNPTRCRRIVGHEGMCDDGCLSWSAKPMTAARGLNALVDEAHANSRAKGFWDRQKSIGAIMGGTPIDAAPLDQAAVQADVPVKLALIHSEVSEALEDWRNGKLAMTVRACCDKPAGKCRDGCPGIGKPEGFPSELADIVIRVFDLAGALGLDLEAAVRVKMAYNATRPKMHGGKRA